MNTRPNIEMIKRIVIVAITGTTMVIKMLNEASSGGVLTSDEMKAVEKLGKIVPVAFAVLSVSIMNISDNSCLAHFKLHLQHS